MPLCIHCNQYVEDNSEAGMTKDFRYYHLDCDRSEIVNKLLESYDDEEIKAVGNAIGIGYTSLWRQEVMKMFAEAISNFLSDPTYKEKRDNVS
jgi:hypothetical protein